MFRQIVGHFLISDHVFTFCCRPNYVVLHDYVEVEIVLVPQVVSI